MINTCVVVAGSARARFFVLQPDSGAHAGKLVEQGSLINPDYQARCRDTPVRFKVGHGIGGHAAQARGFGMRRAHYPLELEQRFGSDIVARAAAISREWERGTLVLVADPRLLGLVRNALRNALRPEIELKELAKDYSHLALGELQQHLAQERLISSCRRRAV